MPPTLQTIRPDLLTLSSEQIHALMPFFWVFGGAMLAMILGVARVFSPKWPVFLTTVAACLGGVRSLYSTPVDVSLFNGMMVVDSYSIFFFAIFMGVTFVTAMASFRYLDREKLQYPEYYILMLFAALGMMFMVSALDLVVVFISLEVMSLSVYILVGFRRADRRSNEAALKYFILGSVASAVFLYGVALVYGATSTTNLHGIAAFLRSQPASATPVFVLGAWLVVLGFLFKIASVPFHMWMPDVYEGAPVPITGFMTTGLKAAAFAAFLRAFVGLGYGHGLAVGVQTHLHDILWVSALATMVVGNFVALTQVSLKRMLAYSSIAHTGYLLVGILAGPGSDQGYAPVVMYLATYAVMNLGVFVILTALSAQEDSGLTLQDLSGLSRRHPWLSFAMAVFMFSMAGIPPTAGFAAKYLLFYSAIQAGEVWLVVLAVLCSAVSVYYYLRVLVYLYMRDPQGSPSGLRVSAWTAVAVAALVAVTLQVGLAPARIVQNAKSVVAGLL